MLASTSSTHSARDVGAAWNDERDLMVPGKGLDAEVLVQLRAARATVPPGRAWRIARRGDARSTRYEKACRQARDSLRAGGGWRSSEHLADEHGGELRANPLGRSNPTENDEPGDLRREGGSPSRGDGIALGLGRHHQRQPEAPSSDPQGPRAEDGSRGDRGGWDAEDESPMIGRWAIVEDGRMGCGGWEGGMRRMGRGG
jgi:hypothetical protein